MSEKAREDKVKRDFWPKVRRTLGKVPFADDAVAAYYAAIDKDTPTKTKAILFGALAYFIVPTDLIPDFIAGLGFTDDAGVLMFALSQVRDAIQPKHKDRAKAALLRSPPGDPDDDAQADKESLEADQGKTA